MSNHKKILDAVNTYYTDKVQQFGDSPKGVDWNSEESQVLRFEQLCKILPQNKEDHFSILDYGCGYGAMYEYIAQNYPNATYIGYDISEAMINKAKQKYLIDFLKLLPTENLPHLLYLIFEEIV